MGESSYANSALQAFIQLECFQEWIKYLNNTNYINNTFFNITITKDIYMLFCCLANGSYLDSSKVIFDYNLKSQELWKKEISKDPYHFVHCLLQILHSENNIMPNPNFNLNLYNQSLINCAPFDNQVLQLFNNYLNQTCNSFISNNFYNIKKFLVNCNNCPVVMYSYDVFPIITFNYENLILKRNQFYPLKTMKKLSLTDCFEISQYPKNIQCRFCGTFYGKESKSLFAASNVLIISIKRYNHNYNFRNDVKFYLDLDISNFIVNKNSENKKFKLKAVVSCYNYNQYLADVYINGCFYRIVDWKQGLDVKPINVNKLMEYEPVLLFYEIDYQGKLYAKMQNLQKIQSVINMAQFFDMMMKNFMFSNSQSPLVQNTIVNAFNYGFNLKFLVIPQNWNKDEKEAFPISPQVTKDSTVKYSIDKFYSKLIKKREAIIKFTYNNNIELDPNTEQKLCDLNIDENSIIYAIKSPNFDNLDLENC